MSALGSLTRLLGVDDKTADNLAIGGALIGTVVGSGVAIKTGGLNDTPLGKSEVVVPNKVGVNNTNTNNGINSGKNVYVTLDTNGKLFFDTNQSVSHFSKIPDALRGRPRRDSLLGCNPLPTWQRNRRFESCPKSPHPPPAPR